MRRNDMFDLHLFHFRFLLVERFRCIFHRFAVWSIFIQPNQSVPYNSTNMNLKSKQLDAVECKTNTADPSSMLLLLLAGINQTTSIPPTKPYLCDCTHFMWKIEYIEKPNECQSNSIGLNKTPVPQCKEIELA